MLTPRTTLKP